MAARSLEELKGKLLFHNSMDIWMTLCREKAWNRHDYTKYDRFITYLKEQKVQLTSAPQGHPMKDASGKPVETYTIKLDKATIDKIRLFT